MNHQFTVYFISHTHWDREWYLTQKQFQFRLQTMALELLGAMEAPRERRLEKFTLDGQTVILEDLLAWSPELRPRIARLIREGRLEIGPWYTMPDLWLPTPEALQANLTRGRQDCAEWGAPYPRFLYIPDSFGMPAGTPGLLRSNGFDTVVFGRSQPALMGAAPIDFTWTDPDGKNPVTALSLPNGYFSAAFMPRGTDRTRLRNWIEELIRAHSNKAVPHLIGAFNGIDHIGAELELPKIIAVLRSLFPQHRFVSATLSEYISAVVAAIPKELPVYRGSMRGVLQPSELHGTWSARQDIKYQDYFCSELLARAGAIRAQVRLRRGALSDSPLRNAWTYLLHNQAHDSICGCSPDPTVSDQHARYRWIQQLATDVIDESLDWIAKKDFANRRGIIFSLPPGGSITGLVEVAVDVPNKSKAKFAPFGGAPMQLLSTEEIERTDVCLAYRPSGPFKEITTLIQRQNWLIQVPTKLPIFFADYHRGTKAPKYLHRRRAALTAQKVLKIIEDLEVVRDVGGLYAHVPEGVAVRWHPKVRSLAKRESGPLRSAYKVNLEYPALSLPSHPLATVPASLKREITLKLYPSLPLAIIEEAWSGQIEYTRVRMALPGTGETSLVQRDEYNQVCSSLISDLKAVPAVKASDRSFFYRSWIQVRSSSEEPVTFFGNGLHEFGLTGPLESQVSVTLLRAQGHVGISGDWPAQDAQWNGVRDFRYALWIGEISPEQRRLLAAELAVPILSKVTHAFVPAGVNGFGHATISSRASGKIASDSPRNWRPQPNYHSGWRQIR